MVKDRIIQLKHDISQ